MSAGGAFGGARGYQPKPPEKGVFPLDHFGECKKWKEQYLDCLKSKGNDAQACRDISMQYLQCRMQRNLMAQQDLKELGLGEDGRGSASNKKGIPPYKGIENDKRKRTGFTAGLPKSSSSDTCS